MIKVNKERITYISILRTFATLMVVLFHSLGYYTFGWGFSETKIMAYDYFDIFINNINMPLFAALSGYLYGMALVNGKYPTKRIVIEKKCIRLLLPYFFWTVFQIIVFPATTKIEMLWTGCLHLWFLLMLFVLFVMFESTSLFWRRFNKHSKITLILCLLIMPIYFHFTSILGVNSAFNMAVYFYVGIVLNDLQFIKKTHCIIIFFFAISVLAAVTIHNGRCNNDKAMFLQRIASLCTVSTLILITKRINLSAGTIVKQVIDVIDSNSMGIYILHHIIIWAIVQITCIQAQLNNHFIIMPLLLFVGSLATSLILSKVLHINRITNLLIGY